MKSSLVATLQDFSGGILVSTFWLAEVIGDGDTFTNGLLVSCGSSFANLGGRGQ